MTDGRSEKRAYFLRSVTVHDYRAAGVLPLSVADGEVVCLLGAELCRTGPAGKVLRHMWRDFGGAREAMDADAAATAGREFAEETLGMFGGASVDRAAVAASAAAMAAQLRAGDRALCVVRPLQRGSYHMYVAATTYIDPILFQLAREQHAAAGARLEGAAEKLEFAWLPLSGLLRAVANTQRQYHYSAAARICSRRAGALGQQHMQLHPRFVHSLRAAQGSGLPELALAVASAARHPLPPRALAAASGTAAAAAAAAECPPCATLESEGSDPGADEDAAAASTPLAGAGGTQPPFQA